MTGVRMRFVDGRWRSATFDCDRDGMLLLLRDAAKDTRMVVDIDGVVYNLALVEEIHVGGGDD